MKGESTETPEKGAVQHHGAYLEVSGKKRKRDGTKVIRDMEVSPEDSVPSLKEEKVETVNCQLLQKDNVTFNLLNRGPWSSLSEQMHVNNSKIEERRDRDGNHR